MVGPYIVFEKWGVCFFYWSSVSDMSCSSLGVRTNKSSPITAVIQWWRRRENRQHLIQQVTWWLKRKLLHSTWMNRMAGYWANESSTAFVAIPALSPAYPGRNAQNNTPTLHSWLPPHTTTNVTQESCSEWQAYEKYIKHVRGFR